MVHRSNRTPCWSTPLISGESLSVGRTLQAQEICDYRANAVASGLFQNQNSRLEQPDCEVIVNERVSLLLVGFLMFLWGIGFACMVFAIGTMWELSK